MRTSFLVLLLIVCVAGCGDSGGQIEASPDLTGINNMVRMMGDTDDEEGWKSLWVEGAAPADNSAYGNAIFILPADPNVSISGDTAEIEVTVLSEGPDTDGDGVADEVEAKATWTAQKVGEKWMMKSAPIP